MFDQDMAELERLVRALEVPPEGRAIERVWAVLGQLGAKADEATGAFAAEGGHQLDGAITMRSWLCHRTGADPTTAAHVARRAAKLHRLPVLRAAFTSGAVSAGAVELVLSHVPNRHLERFAEHEAELVPVLAALDQAGVAAAMRTWRAHADALDPGPAPGELPDTLHFAPTTGDRALVHANLGPDAAAVMAAALRLADSGDLAAPLPQRRAEALGQVCQHFLDYHDRPVKGSRHRPHVNVTMTLEQWMGAGGAPPATDGGSGLPVTAAAAGALRCDAVMHALVHDGRGAVLHYGRGTRVWPRNLVNAIVIRDQGCRWPGCTAPARWCDVHHAVPWERGGTTSLDNGLLLCRRHHHLLHRNVGWHLKLLPDSTVELTHPDGRAEQSRPRGLSPPIESG